MPDDIDFEEIFRVRDSIAPMAREAAQDGIGKILDAGDDFQLSPEQLLVLLAIAAGGIAASNCNVDDEETINARLHFFDDASHTFTAMTRIGFGITKEQIEEISARQKEKPDNDQNDGQDGV